MVILYFIVVVLLLVLGLLFFVNVFITETSLLIFNREEVSSYECGFEHNSLSRIPFSIRYFLLTVVFLIFDMEIVLLIFLPSHGIFVGGISGSFLFIIVFLWVLLFGLFYEWIDGCLDWVM